MPKLTSPEVQSVVIAYLDQKKTMNYIQRKTGLSFDTIKRIKKRGEIKYENEYKNKPGRKEIVSKRDQIRLFIEHVKTKDYQLKI